MAKNRLTHTLVELQAKVIAAQIRHKKQHQKRRKRHKRHGQKQVNLRKPHKKRHIFVPKMPKFVPKFAS